MTQIPQRCTKLAALVTTALLLFACANIDTPPVSGINDRLTTWQLEGKIGLRYDNRAQSAFLKWQQAGEFYTIEVYGPLGKGRVSIIKDIHGVKLVDGDTTYKEDTAEKLLEHTTGLHMPVPWLQWWVRGLPAPMTASTERIHNEQGLLTSFRQQDWQVQYPRYGQSEHYLLPEKVIVNHPDYRLTLAIKSWRALSSTD